MAKKTFNGHRMDIYDFTVFSSALPFLFSIYKKLVFSQTNNIATYNLGIFVLNLKTVEEYANI